MSCLYSVDSDQLASESTLFVIKHVYVNLYQEPGSSNLIGWKLQVGMASKFIQHGKGFNILTCKSLILKYTSKFILTIIVVMFWFLSTFNFYHSLGKFNRQQTHFFYSDFMEKIR